MVISHSLDYLHRTVVEEIHFLLTMEVVVLGRNLLEFFYASKLEMLARTEVAELACENLLLHSHLNSEVTTPFLIQSVGITLWWYTDRCFRI